MLYCPQCGERVKKEDKYCRKCGKSLRKKRVAMPAEEKLPWGKIGVVVSVIAIVGVAACFLTKEGVSPPAETTVKLNPVADAFTDIRDGPDVNYGSDNIAVNAATLSGVWPSGTSEGTFIKFDLSGIPVEAIVTGVAFGAYAYDIWDRSWNSPTTSAVLKAFGTNWDESTITGNNAPWSKLGEIVSSIVHGSVPGWWVHDVTSSYIQGKLGEQVGFYYCYPYTGGGMHDGQRYYSKEHVDSSYRPYLEITFES